MGLAETAAVNVAKLDTTRAKPDVARDLTGDDAEFDTALTELADEGLLDDVVGADAASAAPDPTDANTSASTVDDPTIDQEIATVEAATPQEPTAEPVAVVDPLADTSPLDYGQGKSFDGVLVDKTNGGAFILPDKLDAVRARLLEADTYRDHATQLADRVQWYEGLTYQNTQDGKPQEYKGVDAFIQAQADGNASAAAAMVLVRSIAEIFPGEQYAQGRKELFDKVQFEMRKVAFEARQDIAKQITGAREAQQQRGQQGAHEATWFTNTLGAIQKALPALTPADMEAGRQFFAKRPQMLYRNATPQDAQRLGVSVGERIGDPTAMNEWYSERAALRAGDAAKEAARATADATANKHNAGMEKGRQAGKKPAPARRPQAATPATVSPERVGKKQVYTDILDEALQEMGISD